MTDIKRGSSVKLVNLTIPTLAGLTYPAPLKLTISNALVTRKGDKHLSAEFNQIGNDPRSGEKTTLLVSEIFEVNDINRMHIDQENLALSLYDCTTVVVSALFTMDVSDEEIRTIAATVVQRATSVMRDNVNEIATLLQKITDESHNPNALFK